MCHKSWRVGGRLRLPATDETMTDNKMIEFLHRLGWLVCVVYATIPSFWLLIHPRAERWRTRRRSPYRVLLPVWLAMWVALFLLTMGWRRFTLYASPWPWIPAGLLFAIGLWLYLQSTKHFTAGQLGGLPELTGGHHQQRLVTTGIRAHVRHPIYLAHLCEMLAWTLGTGLAVCYALSAFAGLTGAIMIRMEDAELAKRFGVEYAQYKERVPAVWPKVSQ
jgi:protein-S-isoprenylcysteine O-methyltransferase Ste14